MLHDAEAFHHLLKDSLLTSICSSNKNEYALVFFDKFVFIILALLGRFLLKLTLDEIQFVLRQILFASTFTFGSDRLHYIKPD